MHVCLDSEAPIRNLWFCLGVRSWVDFPLRFLVKLGRMLFSEMCGGQTLESPAKPGRKLARFQNCMDFSVAESSGKLSTQRQQTKTRPRTCFQSAACLLLVAPEAFSDIVLFLTTFFWIPNLKEHLTYPLVSQWLFWKSRFSGIIPFIKVV